MSEISVTDAKYANHYGFSDVYPFEIIKRNTARKLTIRSMIADLDPTWKMNASVGGFTAHVNNNQSQKYIYSSNTNGFNKEIRFSKKYKVWKDKYGNRYFLSDFPVKFHDYNF